MKALIQRVSEASVTIGGECVAAIGRGYLVLFSVTHADTAAMADELARKTVALRIFEDDHGKTNRSIVDVAGAVIVVSQFTLYASYRKGNRPDYLNSAHPSIAEPLYEYFTEYIMWRGCGRPWDPSGSAPGALAPT